MVEEGEKDCWENRIFKQQDFAPYFHGGGGRWGVGIGAEGKRFVFTMLR